ncbi:MAG: SAM-dependent methyltransferase [Xanthobacteraceae bacterium]
MARSASSLIRRRMALAGLAVSGMVAVVAYGRAQGLDVVYVPTPMETVNRMLQLAQVGRSDYLIDLGSGDGRIAVAAGRLGARALGVELDPNRLREAQANAKRAGVTDRVTFRRQNLFEADLSEATVLTMYLLPSINVKLRPRILDLRPGTRVVSHDFSMGDWKSDRTETENWRIHFWIVPARIAGEWRLNSGNQSFNLKIEQHYQEFKGTATVGGRTVPLSNTRLRGNAIEFVIDYTGRKTAFRGTIAGNKMEGSGGVGALWSATRS